MLAPGDIVLVPFPQAELAEGKFRPALVIAVSPDKQQDVLLMQITSRPTQLAEGYFAEIDETDSGFAETGLKVSSFIRVTRLATVAQAVIPGRLGILPKKRMAEVRRLLTAWIKKGAVARSAG